METTELPEVEPPPPEIVASIAAQIRGATVEEPEATKIARKEYRERQALADEAAKEQRRQAEERRAAEVSRQEKIERERVAKEQSKATRERINANLARITEDNRINEIAASSRRSDLFRESVIAGARRRQFFANYDATFRELNEFFNPPKPPLVRLADEE
jgi:hypothetical protein